MNRFILTAVILLLTSSIFAQNFKQAVGIRAGLTAGFEYRVYTDELNSYKFLVGSRERGLIVHALREFHRYELFEFTDQLNFCFWCWFTCRLRTLGPAICVVQFGLLPNTNCFYCRSRRACRT